MPGIRETRRLPYSADQMFDLVADVARYGEFLPWVIATRVRSNSETEMVADMVVGFKAIRESFTSRVRKDRPREIDVHYLDGPLSDLDNVWTFRAVDDRTCEIDFVVDFTFMEQDAAAGEAAGMDMKAMLSAMPEDALRPFVDALVGQMIAEQIKGESCGKIERGLELLSPLPSDNVGGLIAFVVELADLKNPPVCAAPAAARAPR